MVGILCDVIRDLVWEGGLYIFSKIVKPHTVTYTF